MNYKIFDREAQKAIKLSQKIAIEQGAQYTEQGHLLAACLIKKGVVSPKTQKNIYEILQFKYKTAIYPTGKMSAQCENFLTEIENDIFVKVGIEKVGIEYLTERLKENKDLADILKTIEVFQNYGQNINNKVEFAPPAKGKCLDKYARNLTQMALMGKLEPCFGRQNEIERLMRVLNRKTKNNPCLIGEAGVGKTAVVEGLALLMVQGRVPPQLINKQLLSLDLASVVAGTKYRGDFEDRVRCILEEAGKGKGIILFVDEVHTLIGAGAAEGAIDAANILKPALARGQIQLIGATTIQEYRRCIEKDAALERRFAQIMVEEPSREASVNILRGLKSRFEVFHNVTISDEAICAAVDLAIRYLPERFLPDKAIDLLDDTAAGRAIENACERKIAPLMPEDIGKTVTRLTGVPSNELSINEQQKLETLEKELLSEVKGQTVAIKTVANAVIRAKLGFSGTQRPLASFLFCGASGVGKTHLARQMAVKIFGSEKLLFRFDMSEYSEGASASRLIGAPPGYVGHTEPGQLTEAVRRHPFCILLFDEIEKASKEVYGLLLQLLDDGALTDNLGRRVNFKNTIVVATANVASSKCGALGFANGGEMLKTDAEKINFGGLLTTEILGRFDEVVTFDPLKKEAFCDIATKMLFALAQKMAERKIYLTFSSGVVSLIANAGSEKFGARPLRGALRKNVEDVLCKKMINGIIKAGDRVSLTTENETVVVNVTTPQKTEKKPMATVVK